MECLEPYLRRVDTDGAFVLNAGSASNLQIDIETLSASAATVTLGAVSDTNQANGISSIQVDSLR